MKTDGNVIRVLYRNPTSDNDFRRAHLIVDDGGIPVRSFGDGSKAIREMLGIVQQRPERVIAIEHSAAIDKHDERGGASPINAGPTAIYPKDHIAIWLLDPDSN
jgi:hypothetical protein